MTALLPFKLTMPELEAAELRRAYGAASVILEYGTGGSTVVAAEMPGKILQAVESDPAWDARMRAWLVAHPPRSDVRLHLADIGPTKDRGHPADLASFAKWPGYPQSVWQREDFAQPDTVLIDGRFRLACFLTVLANTMRPVTLLWDDYKGRPKYHRAEVFAKPARMVGRMAIFHLTPQTVALTGKPWVIESFLDPL